MYMTIRQLDDSIGQILASKRHTAKQIHAYFEASCSLYDVEAALRIWIRNGWAAKHQDGTYGLTTRWHLRQEWRQEGK